MLSTDKKAFAPFGAVPSPGQAMHMELEKKAFFHFGMNTFTNAEWGDGLENEKSFTPADVDCRQWIRCAKDAGFKLAIITVKHHDGFCLWPSEYTEHTIANSPYKNGKGDIVKEFTDACHEYGMKVGLYISPWDRNSKYWGKDEYSDHYTRQLCELLTDYGEIDEIWWDGAGSSDTVYKWNEWYKTIKELQPKAEMFGSLGAADHVSFRWVGNESGYAGEPHYASIDVSSLRVENIKELNTGKFLGEKYIPAEVDVSIRPGWFYHEDQTDRVKSPLVLDDIWFNSVGRNAMMLLNFPPNRSGVVHELDAQRAKESNDRIEAMRSKNFLDGAAITADGEDISKITDSEMFYASNGNGAVIDIELEEAVKANVFAIGEVFELGERITEVILRDKLRDEVIATATSVGRLRAMRFKPREIKSLRVEIKSPTNVLISTLALWSYVPPTSIAEGKCEKNLLKNSGATMTVDNYYGVTFIAFGGIYPFNTVSFSAEAPCKYKLSAFDGSKFYPLCEGESEDEHITVKTERIDSSYQIKLEIDTKFKNADSFSVSDE